jgi:hypothetical protein
MLYIRIMFITEDNFYKQLQLQVFAVYTKISKDVI